MKTSLFFYWVWKPKPIYRVSSSPSLLTEVSHTWSPWHRHRCLLHCLFTMLSRLIPKPSHFCRFLFVPSKSLSVFQPNFPCSRNPSKFLTFSKYFSTNDNNNGKGKSFPGVWKNFHETEEKFDAFFPEEESGSLEGMNVRDDAGSKAPASGEQWSIEGKGLDNEDEGDIFKGIDKETKSKGDFFNDIMDEGIGAAARNDQLWGKEKGLVDEDEGDIFKGIDKETEGKAAGFDYDQLIGTEDFQPWRLGEEQKDDLFDYPEGAREVGEPSALESDTAEEVKKLEKEDQALTAILKGPNRAFGDLIAASGITDEMLDSLIALKDFEGVEGLPPLSEIEDMRYEKTTKKSIRSEIERQKQEEAARARVRQVDEKGRAYGTGKRKCSVARVWVQPGNGKFIVNDKEFDVYFPMLDHRAALLRPFNETKTLGLWDVNCTVKGGGVSGQVGAIRLGISRALQKWEPGLHPALRNGGFLTRDPRVVERKKPGKAKARKSFQWVKR